MYSDMYLCKMMKSYIEWSNNIIINYTKLKNGYTT